MTTNRIDQTDLRIIMTAFRDLSNYCADAATHELDIIPARYPDTFYCAFLDDDSDYLPAALDMMRELMTALTDDDPNIAATALLERIRRDDTMITDDATRYSDLPLDAPCDLPIRDTYDD